MDGVLLIARLVLAAVFLVAGVTKLLDLRGSREAMRGFGVPEALAGPFGVLLPIAELAVAVFLLPVPTAQYAAIGAAVLLGAFVAGISYNLARGNRPDCHCFGQLHSEPIGASTLIRNVVLAAIGLFIAIEAATNHSAGTSVWHWWTQITGTERIGIVLAAIAVTLLAVEGWFLMLVLRQNGRLLVRLEALEVGHVHSEEPETAPVYEYGPEVGSPAPAFALSGLHGETLTLDALLSHEKPVLFVFSDPQCGPCNDLLPDIGRWQREHGSELTVAQISRGTPEENRAKMKEHGVGHVLLQKDNEIADAYQSPGTPSAVLVGADGTIAARMVAGADGVRDLAARTLGRPGAIPLQDQAPSPMPSTMFEPGAVTIGQPAPIIQLPDVNGRSVSLSEFRGSRTMVLFWNLGCGFCQSMLPDLKKWEQSKAKDAPKLLVVSSGEPGPNKQMGLRAPVLLDQDFATATSFGATGTPMAVIIDEDGNVASNVAAGAPSVFALAAGSPEATAAPAG